MTDFNNLQLSRIAYIGLHGAKNQQKRDASVGLYNIKPIVKLKLCYFLMLRTIG